MVVPMAFAHRNRKKIELGALPRWAMLLLSLSFLAAYALGLYG
jgi:hypothetical protein